MLVKFNRLLLWIGLVLFVLGFMAPIGLDIAQILAVSSLPAGSRPVSGVSAMGIMMPWSYLPGLLMLIVHAVLNWVINKRTRPSSAH